MNGSEVAQFLLEHIQLDLRILREVFGKTGDEINVIIHLFLKHIASVSRPGKTLTDVYGSRSFLGRKKKLGSHFVLSQ